MKVNARQAALRAQERLAKERLVANLSEDPELRNVAYDCGLPRQFVRTSRNTVGMPPFR